MTPLFQNFHMDRRFALPRRIAVATDLNDADLLMPYAIAQARVTGAHLCLIHPGERTARVGDLLRRRCSDIRHRHLFRTGKAEFSLLYSKCWTWVTLSVTKSQKRDVGHPLELTATKVAPTSGGIPASTQLSCVHHFRACNSPEDTKRPA